MIVAHGHFNRCLIARWIGLPLSEGARPENRAQGYSSFTGTKLNVEAGGVGHSKLTQERLMRVVTISDCGARLQP